MMDTLLLITIASALVPLAASECIMDNTAARCNHYYISKHEPPYVLGKPKLVYFHQLEGEIPAGAFKEFPYADELEIHPGVTYLAPGAFEGLKSIRLINLFNNSIRYVVRGTFKGCHNLQQLILKHNRLNYIEAMAFEELVNLQTLDLSENPEMGVLRDYTFSGLRSLILLQCVVCGIHNIEPLAFYNTSHIRELNLQSNFIGDLNGTEFEQLRNLEELDLTANNIAHINVEAMLRNLPRLKHISLKFNRINCYDIREIETRFQRRNVIVYVRTTDRNNNQILSCLETQ